MSIGTFWVGRLRMTKGATRLTLVFTLALAGAAHAQGDSACFAGESSRSMSFEQVVGSLAAPACLQKQAEESVSWQATIQPLENRGGPGSNAEVLEAAISALDQVRVNMMSTVSSASRQSQTFQDLLRAMEMQRSVFVEARRAPSLRKEISEKYLSVDAWDHRRQEVVVGDVTVQVRMLETLSGCKSEPYERLGSACKDAIWDFEQLTTAIFSVAGVIEFATEDIAEGISFDNEQLHNKWRSYVYDGQFMYPWELAINNAVGSSRQQRTDDWGNPLGLTTPPRGRLIVLHPDIGFQFSDTSDSTEASPAFTLEAVGYQWFTGWNQSEQRYKHPLGLGVMLAWTPRENGDDFGWGTAFHYRSYTLSALRFGGDWGVMINFDMMQFLGTEKDEALKRSLSPAGSGN